MKNILYVFLILFFLVGCVDSSNEEIVETSGEYNQETESYSTAELESQLYEEFKNYTVDALIADKTLYDINDDGVVELIVLFSAKDEPASFAIISQRDMKGISLSGGTTSDIRITDTSTLEILDNPKRVLIRVTDFKNGMDVDFEVQVTYDKDKKHMHFILSSEDVK